MKSDDTRGGGGGTAANFTKYNFIIFSTNYQGDFLNVNAHQARRGQDEHSY